MHRIDENLWFANILRRYIKNLAKLSFYQCSFKRINDILSEHINIIHLSLDLVAMEDELTLTDHFNLKSLKLTYTNITKTMPENTIRNNPSISIHLQKSQSRRRVVHLQRSQSRYIH